MEMKLLFAGDVMLGRLVNRYLSERDDPEYPWGDTLEIFRKADLRFCNLECVISDRGAPWSYTPKVFHFRSDSRNIRVLKAADINAVSLANNHILDYEHEAMFDTISALDRNNIKFSGAGKDLDEASRPAYLKAGGARIAFISFTDNEPGWEAQVDSPGVFYLPIISTDRRARLLFQKISEAKRVSDIVVVSAHWGPNWGYKPPARHMSFAHEMIEKGADVIFGHSCHVFQGVEIYKGKPIIYSAGDFVDDYAVDEIERNDESFIFMVELQDLVVKGLRLYPGVIRDFSARLADDFKAHAIASRMRRLCADFNTLAHWDGQEKCLKIIAK